MAFHTPIDQLREIHGRMRGVAQRLRLPFRSHQWKGTAGNWLGVGIGSSIDFQDHRPYLPGDDPRYIDWHAYARTGSYTMKLYREEVSPRVDILLDTSASMALTDDKRVRCLELLYFSLESALQTNASVSCAMVNGTAWAAVPLQALLGHRWEPPDNGSTSEAPALSHLPLRHGSLRVWISDLLYPGAPEWILQALRSRRGRGLVYAPYAPEEEAPPWDGNVELIDCETGAGRRQRVVPDIRRRYGEAYRRHFDLWADQARKYDITFARVPTEGAFLDDLHRDAIRAGAAETWN